MIGWGHHAIRDEPDSRPNDRRVTPGFWPAVRLWEGNPREPEARSRLSQVYDSFTEGLDANDLRDARALLYATGSDGDSARA
jgi:hypothetical protein